ncbi:metallophosphoesterase [Phenylobacterium sp.]|uniref:metallophosphoesterase family protein n=1 Tax=Phenylobacterium sp. TaxID=1871053 RepID=UPI0012235865|nr:metallophosphoesterase [Phenylobacterium sp.]THD61449.1 MAG: metallophosphoesterase [Phenylobacterium sp.]
MRRTAAILFVLGVMGLPAVVAAAPAAAWVQMTGAGAEVRAVSDGSACPALDVDGKPRAMSLRAGPDEAFANRICEAPLPKGAKHASVEGVALPLPKARPQRLVILGDSGCRLKGPVVQDCNDPVGGWPFAKVAALAAAQKPDLVIHVGDYYYRETPCPPLMGGCAGSPYGDKWLTWKAELFDPAQGLLKAAPWVFARGNHEDCQRGGKGWFRLLDADPKALACPAGHSATFAVDIGGARLAVLDSADPDDTHLNADQTAAFAADLKAIPAGATPVWLVTHRPLWEVFRAGSLLTDTGGNANERQAVRTAGLGQTEMIVAGHLHTFYSLDAVAGRPSQLVVGTGGDILDSNKAATPVIATIPVDGAETPAFAMDRFGYFVLDRVGQGAADDWVGVFHDLTDKVIARCTLRAGRLACVAA